ncbi:MAG: hypothetical protein LBN38_03080 [Verrucomicrobiota bacterium]|nr:hypothetical protein [Verrucomicrobiota bacterium]
MKRCMVAAVAFSLLFSVMALAQEDEFDLDFLLEGFEEAPAETSTEPVMAEIEEVEYDSTDDEFLSDDSSMTVESTPPAMMEETASEGDVDDLFADPFAEIAPPAGGTATAPVSEENPFADDALLGDLFAQDDSTAVLVEDVEFVEPVEMAPVADEFDYEAVDEDDSMAFEDSMSAPAAESALPSTETQDVARETGMREEVRRQAAEADALKSSETGFRALSAGDYVAAETAFTSALNTMPERAQTAAARDQMAWGLAEAQYLRARGMVQRNERLEDARTLVDSALKASPSHRGAQALDKRLSRLEAAAAIPKPPSRQPATLQKNQTIEQLYDEARQWYNLQDYDRATALFERILNMDPYHKSAMRYLRKIEADKYKLATYEREARVQGMMTDVRRSWSPPVRVQIELPDGPEAGTERRVSGDRLQEKMQRIIIPSVEFRQANINDVVTFLVDASIAADPEGEGVNIILNLGTSGGVAASAPASAPMEDEWGFPMEEDYSMSMSAPSSGGSTGVSPITLNLRRISMLDAIKYITEVANLKYRIEESAVMITRIDAPIGNIITRMYPVQPSFINVIVERQGASADDRDEEFVSMSGRVSVTKSDVKDFFEKTGVQFPAGASITYNATISQLIIANTADNLETFERILQQLNVVPNQVEIEARFIEVDQTDLEELGLQWILNDSYEFATKKDGSGGRMQLNANQSGFTQGLRFFGYNAGNLNIEPTSMLTQTANQTVLGGILSASSVLTNPEVTVVLQALSQHGGSDLLSAPRVTTRSGVNAQIQVVREIIYPTEFDVTQPTMNSDGNVTMSPVVTPGTFETRETGVILNVTPTVGPDGYTIDLVMAPEVAELVDWIQYGSQITVETGIIGARQANTYQFNMPMPVFTSRNVTTSIVIWDGQTVVMGGLIREELTTIKDKVPILGDIPLLGWLFRSEGQYSRKKNLLIFVTARLVDPAGRPIHTDGAMPGQGIESGEVDLSSLQ